MASKQIKATVIIPTFNGEQYLKKILTMLFKQNVDFVYEVLIIDSGSKDETLSIISASQKLHKNLRLVEIPNHEFGHGKTRNLGAQLAKGEFLVYLSHDAVPAHKNWLYEILKPFELNEKIVAVLGKQDPRPKCFPLMKYDIEAVFKAIGTDHGTTLMYKDSFAKKQEVQDFLSFYSDVNSATRRDFLLNTIPYQDVPYSEDQLFGKDIINAGYIKAYAPRANVTHSNDIKLVEYKRRIFDETVGLRKTGHTIHRLSVSQFFGRTVRGILIDWKRILSDRRYGKKRKLYWLVINPFFHIERNRGLYIGSRIDLRNEKHLTKHSLEHSRKDNL